MLMIEKGLVIASPWIEKIIIGQKTWEIRNRPASRSGRIALCRKGGLIVATCLIGPSLRITRERFGEHFEKHRVSPDALRKHYPTGPLFAWPLSDVQRFPLPIEYKHPAGGPWVKLTGENVREWERLPASA